MNLGPIAFAFGAGMVATVNPCGFAMLPAYVSLLIANSGRTASNSAVYAGLRVGVVITGAFVATFAVVGLVFRFVNDALIDALPWIIPFIGVGLIGYGLLVLSGRHINTPTMRVRPTKDGSRHISIALFGLAYAITSVSCTLVIFLSVITAAATAATVFESVIVFAAYGFGMGVVLVAIAVAVATSRATLLARMRSLAPYVERAGGWLMVVSGVFVFYYWLTVHLTDVNPDNPFAAPIVILDDLSAWLSTEFTENTIGWALSLGILILLVGMFEVRRARRR